MHICGADSVLSWHGLRDRCAAPPPPYSLSFALVPAGCPSSQPQLLRFDAGVVDLHFPTDRPGIALRCRIETCSEALSRIRRDIRRVANHQSSTWAIAGLVLLLAVCGWIVEGADGAHRAVSTEGPRSNNRPISREAIYQWFGARPLSAAAAPTLFCILAEVCRRAGLRRYPELYYIATRGDMNAYALGGPDDAAIVLTAGLLRGMNADELAGILAHEVAHIYNNDAWAMDWVVALGRAIEWTSLCGLAAMRARSGGLAANQLHEMLLNAAPALGRLLSLALCRVRELDADATALELIGDSCGLIAALDKLERHHAGAPGSAANAGTDNLHLLSSHPATAEKSVCCSVLLTDGIIALSR